MCNTFCTARGVVKLLFCGWNWRTSLDSFLEVSGFVNVVNPWKGEREKFWKYHPHSCSLFINSRRLVNQSILFLVHSSCCCCLINCLRRKVSSSLFRCACARGCERIILPLGTQFGHKLWISFSRLFLYPQVELSQIEYWITWETPASSVSSERMIGKCHSLRNKFLILHKRILP